MEYCNECCNQDIKLSQKIVYFSSVNCHDCRYTGPIKIRIEKRRHTNSTLRRSMYEQESCPKHIPGPFFIEGKLTAERYI